MTAKSRIKKFKQGMKVRAIENHPLMEVSRRHVGIVDEAGPNCGGTDQEVSVKFRHKPGTTVFQGAELKALSRPVAKLKKSECRYCGGTGFESTIE